MKEGNDSNEVIACPPESSWSWSWSFESTYLIMYFFFFFKGVPLNTQTSTDRKEKHSNLVSDGTYFHCNSWSFKHYLFAWYYYYTLAITHYYLKFPKFYVDFRLILLKYFSEKCSFAMYIWYKYNPIFIYVIIEWKNHHVSSDTFIVKQAPKWQTMIHSY